MAMRIKREKLLFTIPWLRCILALIVGIALIAGRRNISLFIFILAILIGFFDGFIAKRYPSMLRSVIDFFADKLLVNVAAMALAFRGIIPFWVALIFLARDMLTVIGGTILLYKGLRREFKPTVLGKISYFFQIMALIPPIINFEIDWYLMSAALALTFASGAYALIKSEFRFARKETDLDEFRM